MKKEIELRSGIRLILRDAEIRDIPEVIDVENICFPPNEACPPESMRARITAAPGLFLIAEDAESGKIAGFLNGFSTSEKTFRDEFFTDITLYEPEGDTVMLFGLDVLPAYRRQGLAGALVREYAARQSSRRALVLTCLEEKLPMYLHLGFRDDGIANSSWGGEVWHQMTLPLGE